MTIIAMIHYKGKKLPNKRVELYDVSTETFLEYWVQLRMGDESQLKDKTEIVEILAPIAFEIHQNKSNALIEEQEFVESFLWNFKNVHTNTSDKDAQRECKEFINFLRQQTGFFYEKGVDDDGNRFYGFIHLTFEEYLAAIELVSRWNEGDLDLKDYVFNPRWTEIIRLAACQLRLSYKGRAGRTQATKFVKDILTVEDPFPEAYRSLQLVCLILADDVNIMDELLNEILDEIVEVASKTDFDELIESFSRLFKEVLYSDYRNAFINRLQKEVITDNATLLNNVIYLLVSNSWDCEINNLLTSFLNKNEEIRKAIYQIDLRNFPFQESECYKNNFTTNLSYLISQDDEEGIKRAKHNFMRLVTKKPWFEWGKRDNIQNIINALDQIPDTQVFDIILDIALKYLLSHYIINIDKIDKEGLIHLLRKYPENALVMNLNKSLNEINLDEIKSPRHGYSSFSLWELRHYTSLIRLNKEDKKLQFWFWSRHYDKLRYHSVSSSDISSYLKNLKKWLSDSEIDIVELNIYKILGPQKNADTENTTRFIKAYEHQMLHDFFGWELFPLINITSNPSMLSKIIVQYGQRYLYIRGIIEEKIGERINLKDFNNKNICPLTKLVAYHLLNKPYNQKLLDESIVYFKGCSPEEKKGAFSILYKLLNPFELA
jgi:hypothetical protein